jgi:hypothetical protein
MLLWYGNNPMATNTSRSAAWKHAHFKRLFEAGGEINMRPGLDHGQLQTVICCARVRRKHL